MQVKQVAKLPAEQRLYYWIKERETIRLKRVAEEPPPWTDDRILHRYRFCNVRRMDDRVSQWLLQHWYEPFRNHPNMLAAAALARHYNLPSVLQRLTDAVFLQEGRSPQWDIIKARVRAMKKSGRKVFSAAYMVRGIGEIDKTEMVVERVCKPLHESNTRLNTDSMEESWEALLPCWGFSSFMAGQVIADLRWALTGSWSDRYTWAPIGPGSRRGMNRLRGVEPESPLSQKEFLEQLRNLIASGNKCLSSSITHRLEAIDWQNCLCEFDRYERTIWGEGKPKRLYRSNET